MVSLKQMDDVVSEMLRATEDGTLSKEVFERMVLAGTLKLVVENTTLGHGPDVTHLAMIVKHAAGVAWMILREAPALKETP